MPGGLSARNGGSATCCWRHARRSWAAKRTVGMARDLHFAEPGAYGKLSAFATSNVANVWGARAALALGSDDYSKKRGQQALAWFHKASSDSVLREYILYWTAQAEHALGHSKEALDDLETVQHDYPNTAMKEQLLASLAPVATEFGHPQEAIDALNSYPATDSDPRGILLRAQAYQAAHQLAQAARDYQAIFYKYSQSDEAKDAESPLKKIMHGWARSIPIPALNCSSNGRRRFMTRINGKKRGWNSRSSWGCCRSSIPNRQLAESGLRKRGCS